MFLAKYYDFKMNIERFITQWLSRIILKVVSKEIKVTFRKVENIQWKIAKERAHLIFNED